jgi:hypothetical protein
MTVQPPAAWIGTPGLHALATWLDTQLMPDAQAHVWEILTPFLAEDPGGAERTWFAQLRAALAAAPALSATLAEAVHSQLQRLVWEARWQGLKAALLQPGEEPITDAEAIRRIEALAARAFAGGSEQERRDFLAEAPCLLRDAFARFEATRPFNPWAWGVLRHKSIDQYRRRRRERARDKHTAAATDDGEAWGDARALLREVRAWLDTAVFFPSQADGVDFYAVFVLELRLRWAEQVGRLSIPAAAEGGAGAVAALVDHFLPWRPWERPRRVKLGWPALADLWEHLTSCGAVPPEGRRVDAVVAAVGRLAPALTRAEPLLPATWIKWVNRGKKRFQETLPEDVWGELFARMFFDRRPRRRCGRQEAPA